MVICLVCVVDAINNHFFQDWALSARVVRNSALFTDSTHHLMGVIRKNVNFTDSSGFLY